MKKQLQVWKLIYKSLQQNIPVMLLYVLQSNGSSPGRAGFCMAVNTKGEMVGSIGGGIMEHKFVEMAKEKLKQKGKEITIRKQIHDKQAARDRSGMICSGEQTNFLYPIRKSDAPCVTKIIDCLENLTYGTVQFSPAGLSFSQIFMDNNYEFYYKTDEYWSYKEKLGYKNHLYIVGGGHCALAFSKLMSMLDFYIHLYDHRPDLNTFAENEFVHQKLIVKDYSALKEIIPPGDNNYVVIMTFGYRTDDAALKALVGKQFKYLGVLGSAKKIQKMFDDYAEEGISKECLSSIYAPVGLFIHSQTPEEIAISIAAQIIGIKNGA